MIGIINRENYREEILNSLFDGKGGTAYTCQRCFVNPSANVALCCSVKQQKWQHVDPSSYEGFTVH